MTTVTITCDDNGAYTVARDSHPAEAQENLEAVLAYVNSTFGGSNPPE